MKGLPEDSRAQALSFALTIVSTDPRLMNL